MRPAFHRARESRRIGEEETRMKVFQSLTAVMLCGALSVGSNFAVAKVRNHISHAGSRATRSSYGGQRSEDNRLSSNNPGANQNVRGPVNAGTTKQGTNVRGNTSPPNVGAAPGKNQPDLNAMSPGGADVGPGTPVIADGPGHKTNRPADTMKKITTIVRPHVVRPHRPTGLGKIERNSIGAHYDARPNLGLNPKVTVRINSVPMGTPGLSTTRRVPYAGGMPTATVRLGHNLTNPPLHGPIIYGSSFGRSGSNVTGIGGPTKNIALNGNTFRPKHP
jgi:hypothetical protein